jgi:hypothetical protein
MMGGGDKGLFRLTTRLRLYTACQSVGKEACVARVPVTSESRSEQVTAGDAGGLMASEASKQQLRRATQASPPCPTSTPVPTETNGHELYLSQIRGIPCAYRIR